VSDSMKKELKKIGILGGAGAVFLSISVVPGLIEAGSNVGTVILTLLGTILLGALAIIGLVYGYPTMGGWIAKAAGSAGKSFLQFLGTVFKDIFDGGFPIVPILKLSFALTMLVMAVFIAIPVGWVVALRALTGTSSTESSTSASPWRKERGSAPVPPWKKGSGQPSNPPKQPIDWRKGNPGQQKPPWSKPGNPSLPPVKKPEAPQAPKRPASQGKQKWNF